MEHKDGGIEKGREREGERERERERGEPEGYMRNEERWRMQKTAFAACRKQRRAQ